jgi:hypothetical protein
MFFLGDGESLSDEIKLGMHTQPAGLTGSELSDLSLGLGRDFRLDRSESIDASQHNLATAEGFRLFFTARNGSAIARCSRMALVGLNSEITTGSEA